MLAGDPLATPVAGEPDAPEPDAPEPALAVVTVLVAAWATGA